MEFLIKRSVRCKMPQTLIAKTDVNVKSHNLQYFCVDDN